MENVKPDLPISADDITFFSNRTPTVGETITITTNISDTGPAQAEVEALFSVTTNFKHKAILMITYSSGLRISEAAHLLYL